VSCLPLKTIQQPQVITQQYQPLLLHPPILVSNVSNPKISRWRWRVYIHIYIYNCLCFVYDIIPVLLITSFLKWYDIPLITQPNEDLLTPKFHPPPLLYFDFFFSTLARHAKPYHKLLARQDKPQALKGVELAKIRITDCKLLLW